MDESATHLLLRLVPSLKPIGTIRIFEVSHYYKLTRVCILEDYRQFRFGRELVDASHAWVKQHASTGRSHGFVDVAVSSQIPVKGFYAK